METQQSAEQIQENVDLIQLTLNRLSEIYDKILDKGIESLKEEDLAFIEAYNSRPLVVDVASSVKPFQEGIPTIYRAVTMEFSPEAVGKERNTQNAFTVQDIMEGEVYKRGQYFKIKVVKFSEGEPRAIEQ